MSNTIYAKDCKDGYFTNHDLMKYLPKGENQEGPLLKVKIKGHSEVTTRLVRLGSIHPGQPLIGFDGFDCEHKDIEAITAS